MLTAQDLIQIKIQSAEDGKEEEEVAVDDSGKGKLKRSPSLPLPPEEKDPNVKTIKDLLTDARLDSYLDIAKQQKVYLFDLWTADEKKVETLIEKMKMKPGHVLRLKRSLENAKEAIEKWIVLPHVTPQMNPAQRSLSFYSDNKVSFEDFKTLIKTNDVEALEKFMDRYDNNEKVLRHFLKERFKAQTKQSLRDLRNEDADTLLWIRKLYRDPKHDRAIQPLPFKYGKGSFIRHLLLIEATVRGFKEVWTIQDPSPIIFGFISRRQTHEALRHAKPGVFLFRLSISTPEKIVVCYKKPRVVAQKLVPAFKNVDEFKRFAKKNETNLRFVADNELSSACSLQKMIRVLESKEHEKNMREAFKHFNDMYETRRSE